MEQSKVSSLATPGRLHGQGLSEGQPLSFPRYRLLHLVFGVGVPALAIVTELLTGWSAGAYANPFPNVGFLALAACVPLANLISWLRLCLPAPSRLLSSSALGNAANRLALVVSFGYCLLFLPIVPVALILSVFAVGVLPLAPFFAFHTAWRLRSAEVAKDPASLLLFLGGIPGLSAARKLLCQSTQ